METCSTYFQHLSETMAQMFGEILRQDGFTFFRKHAQVTLGNAGAGSTYVLSLTKATETPEDKGTFTSKFAGDTERFVVYRSPTRMTTSFLLEGKGLSATERMGALDKLTRYFFDNRTIEPILPKDFAKNSSLRERMLLAKAELKPTDIQPFVAGSGQTPTLTPDRFLFAFEYCALFHSGNVLREDTKAKQRVIDFNDTNQRSN